MTAERHVVIVGASLAGVRTAESLRDGGFADRITMIGDEVDAPYDRPPLSKQLLGGTWEPDRIALADVAALTDRRGVELRLGVRAVQLDLAERTIRTVEEGSRPAALAFTDLVIATGARVRTLPGTSHLAHVHVVRTLADSLRLRAQLIEGRRVVVIGAGFIGAEVAATASNRGCVVTILEALDVPLSRQLGDQMGAACAALHERNGVALRTGVRIDHIDDSAVVLATGERVGADVVVVGIGVQPNVEWLDGSGIALEDGVRCDDRLRVLGTNGGTIGNVVAVGDVARWPNALFGAAQDPSEPELMRIEHWTNAAESAAHAAGTLLGVDAAFAPVPYFWSDQYAHKIQFLGRTTAFDEVRVVDGSVDDGAWLALYRRSDRLIGALGVTRMRLLMGYRRLLADRATWTDALAHAGVA